MVCTILYAIALSFSAGARAQTFISFDVPGSTGTDARGINNDGAVVGAYDDSAGVRHGYVFKDGNFTTIDYPGAVLTAAIGINSRGDIVGCRIDDATRKATAIGCHGFLLRDGAFTSVDYPGKYGSVAARIDDAGQIVGCNHDDMGPGGFMTQDMHGLLFSDGNFTQLSRPNTMNYGVTADGSVTAGVTVDTPAATGPSRGYLASNDVVVPFDFPFSTSTQVHDMSPSGDMVLGSYADAANKSHGFLLRMGDSIATFGLNPKQGLTGPFEFVTIDYPGATATNAMAFNRRGDIVGSYVDPAGKTHAFLVNLGRHNQDEGQ